MTLSESASQKLIAKLTLLILVSKCALPLKKFEADLIVESSTLGLRSFNQNKQCLNTQLRFILKSDCLRKNKPKFEGKACISQFSRQDWVTSN